MRRWLRLAVGLLLATGLAAGCLSIEQDACEVGETLCVDGSVWACTDDGSGWTEEARCPDGACEAGRCVLEPLPVFDAGLGSEDAIAPAPDAATGDSSSD